MLIGKNRTSLVLAMAFAGLLAAACAAPQTEAQEGDTKVVARVGDQKITLEELDEKAKAANMQAYQALYEARRGVLDGLVADKLIEAEAASRGVSKEALIEKEITSKTPAVSDSDVEAFYNENKARMGGRPLDAVKGQIREFLVQRNGLEFRQKFLDGLKKKTTVRVSLDAPRAVVQVAKNDPRKGPPGAPIQLVEFSEFQ